jgi:hypothetical protein
LSAEVSDLGKPEKVNTPPAAPAAAGLLSAIVARILAMPVVPISRTPVVPIAVVTASSLAFFTAVEYVTAISYLPILVY